MLRNIQPNFQKELRFLSLKRSKDDTKIYRRGYFVKEITGKQLIFEQLYFCNFLSIQVRKFEKALLLSARCAALLLKNFYFPLDFFKRQNKYTT